MTNEINRDGWPKTEDEKLAFMRAAAAASRKSKDKRSDDDVALIESFAAWRAEGSKVMSTPKSKSERKPAERVRYFVDGRRLSDALSRIHEVAFSYTKQLTPERVRLTTSEFETLLREEHSVENARTHGWSATLRNGRRITAAPFDTESEPSKLVRESVKSSKPELGVVESKPKAEPKSEPKSASKSTTKPATKSTSKPKRQTAAQKRAMEQAKETADRKAGRSPRSTQRKAS